MWLIFVLMVANGLVAWLAVTAWTRRWARRRVATSARSLEQILDHAGGALHAGSLQEVFERAASCARDVWGSTGMMLIYLARDRMSCRVLRWGQPEIERPEAYWDALLAAPWHLGILTRTALGAPAWTGITQPLQSLTHELEMDVFVPWIERDKLVCVTGMRFGRALDRYDYALLDLWNMGLIQACANYIIAARAASHDLASELEQASSIVQALASQGGRGAAGGLSWIVHARRRVSDQLGSGFWDVRRLSNDRLVVIAGETIAAGLAASMLSTAISGCCDTLHALVGDDITPGRVLSHINSFLWRRTNPIGMSCIAIVIDPRIGLMHHAVAGPIGLWRLHWSDGEAVLESRPHRGPLLGDRLDVEFQSRESRVSEGDVFLILPQQMSMALWPQTAPSDSWRDPRFDGVRQESLEEIRERVLAAAASAAHGDSVPMVLVRRGYGYGASSGS
jgi:Stage II sporulation protein E (SpoIIE)